MLQYANIKHGYSNVPKGLLNVSGEGGMYQVRVIMVPGGGDHGMHQVRVIMVCTR